ncbi:putative F-box protein At1g32420 [Coffea eugenioides]|uniref:putative F-box protein At1g32420 n=1 Tax=Coffea eugenioides TaxID=49369 RepID=UPI000F607EFF|nr:putative F-box protein At1g32420 [Coffea eugenioides]
MQPSSSLHIPEEIIFDVLSKLPVKTLVRFCCVSKSWRNLITSDPVFIYSHLQKSLKNGNNNPGEIRNVLLDTRAICPRSSSDLPMTRALGINCDCPKSFVPGVKQLTEQFRVNPGADINLCRLIFVEGPYFLAGCCDGIVCFFNRCYRIGKLSIHLWNPVLNQCKTLPWIDCIRYCIKHDVYFTRNPVSHDYQVVKISHPEEGCFRVQIYSLGNNSWKQISPDILPPPHQNLAASPLAYRWNLVVHNGFAHWCARNQMDSKLCLNVLDINQEKIRQLSLPDCLPNFKYPTLEEFEGCLAFSDLGHGGSELWVMKEHGEHMSCIKHIKVSEIHPLRQRTTGLIASGQLLAASKEKANGLVLYDPDKRCVEEPMEKELKCKRFLDSHYVVDYVPSLVSVFLGEDRDFQDFQNSSCIEIFKRRLEEEKKENMKNRCSCTRWTFLPECSSVLGLELKRRYKFK